MKIKLVSGDIFTIGDRDEQFIDKIIEVLRDAAVNDSAKYSISMDARTIQYYQNNGVIIISSGDPNWITTYSAGEKKTLNNVTVEDSSVGSGNQYDIKQGLTEDEWATLNWYFIECQAMYTKQTKQFKACTEILHTIEKRDAPSLKKTLRDIGDSVLNGIVSTGAGFAMSQAAKIILDKINTF